MYIYIYITCRAWLYPDLPWGDGPFPGCTISSQLLRVSTTRITCMRKTWHTYECVMVCTSHVTHVNNLFLTCKSCHTCG